MSSSAGDLFRGYLDAVLWITFVVHESFVSHKCGVC